MSDKICRRSNGRHQGRRFGGRSVLLPDSFMILRSSSRLSCTYTHVSQVRPNIYSGNKSKKAPSEVRSRDTCTCVQIFRVYLLDRNIVDITFCCGKHVQFTQLIVITWFQYRIEFLSYVSLTIYHTSQAGQILEVQCLRETFVGQTCLEYLRSPRSEKHEKYYLVPMVFLRKRVVIFLPFDGLRSVGTRFFHQRQSSVVYIQNGRVTLFYCSHGGKCENEMLKHLNMINRASGVCDGENSVGSYQPRDRNTGNNTIHAWQDRPSLEALSSWKLDYTRNTPRVSVSSCSTAVSPLVSPLGLLVQPRRSTSTQSRMAWSTDTQSNSLNVQFVYYQLSYTREGGKGEGKRSESEPHGSHTQQNSGRALSSKSSNGAGKPPTDTKRSPLESAHRHLPWLFTKQLRTDTQAYRRYDLLKATYKGNPASGSKPLAIQPIQKPLCQSRK